MLAGCGLSSVTSGLGTSIMGGSSASAEASSVNEQDLLAAAKASGGDQVAGLPSGDASPGCPRFVVWPRDSHLTIYEPGRVGDGLAIVHRIVTDYGGEIKVSSKPGAGTSIAVTFPLQVGVAA